MAITCPRCGAEFDVTLFQFGRGVRCSCGTWVEYPGKSLSAGHALAQGAEALDHKDRCLGCLLGTACGDILGAAVEGWSAAEIRAKYGQIRHFLDSGRGFGCYTDDTQMTLALAISLVERGRLDAAHVSATYAAFYEPMRGYGGAASRVMKALASGGDYRGTGRLQFPEGSFGNGGAMRIAPVGLAYRHANTERLRRAVEDALLCTHIHPEAVDGALVQAKAVALAATHQSKSLDPAEVIGALVNVCGTDVMRAKLEALAAGLLQGHEDVFVIARVGNGIRASQAVAAALWAFLRYAGEPEECIVRAVGFGGDTDTVAAMAGALVGALHGATWIPARWYEAMENGDRGRDAIAAVGRELSRLDLT